MNNKKGSSILISSLFGHDGHCKTIAYVVISISKDILLHVLNTICIQFTTLIYISMFNVIKKMFYLSTQYVSNSQHLDTYFQPLPLLAEGFQPHQSVMSFLRILSLLRSSKQLILTAMTDYWIPLFIHDII